MADKLRGWHRVRWPVHRVERALELRQTGLSHRLIGERLGIPEETVRSWCNRRTRCQGMVMDD